MTLKIEGVDLDIKKDTILTDINLELAPGKYTACSGGMVQERRPCCR